MQMSRTSAFVAIAPMSISARKEATTFQSPRDLVARFASTVTERTQVGLGCIAKNGDVSLFSAFQWMVPQVLWLEN
jgi:hypothetical protein